MQDLDAWVRALRPKQPLRPYQIEALRAFERALYDTFFHSRLVELLIMWPRQSGKNEVDAVWALRFLSFWGALASLGRLPVARLEAIRTAPTYKPGVAVSKRRLEFELQRWRTLTGQGYSKGEGYAYRIEQLEALLKLLSANEDAQKRGETANGYLSVDECQHTDNEVAQRELNPMRADTGAPAFYNGTQWTEESLINVKLHELLELEAKDGYKRVFRVPWWDVALYNPRYGRFVQAERDRLGAQHPIYLSEYRLVTVSGQGRFTDEAGLKLLFGGQHKRGKGYQSGETYVGGVDFCGAGEQPDEAAFDPERAQAHDNTCAWVNKMSWKELPGEDGEKEYLIYFQAVDALFLPDQHPEKTPDRLEEFLFGKWRCSNVWLDGNGVGDSPSHILHKRRPNQTEIYHASRPKNSAQGLLLKACIDTGRLQIWSEEIESDELALIRQQFTLLQRKILPGGGLAVERQPGTMVWGHPTRMVLWRGNKVRVHDDGPKACALAVQAGHEHLAKRKPPDRKREFRRWDETPGVWRPEETA